MIGLPKPRIRNLIEAMPVKCRVIGSARSLGASTLPDVRSFYKVVAPVSFAMLKGQVAYVEAAEWKRAKQAGKKRAEEREGGGKPLSATRRREMKRERERGRLINLYFEFSYSSAPRREEIVSVVSTGDVDCDAAVLLPPTTTASDMLAFLKPLARTPELLAAERSLKRILRLVHRLHENRTRLATRSASRLAELTARSLRTTGRRLPARGPRQPLPEPVTLPAMTNDPDRGEEAHQRTERQAFFKAVVAQSPQSLREPSVGYVLTKEWADESIGSVQTYMPLGAAYTIKMGVPPRTVEKSGSAQRELVMLLPPSTDPATLRETVERAEASDPEARRLRSEADRIEAMIRAAWTRIEHLASRERRIQTRLLRGVLAQQRPALPA